jgi:hypothetical protein
MYCQEVPFALIAGDKQHDIFNTVQELFPVLYAGQVVAEVQTALYTWIEHGAVEVHEALLQLIVA